MRGGDEGADEEPAPEPAPASVPEPDRPAPGTILGHDGRDVRIALGRKNGVDIGDGISFVTDRGPRGRTVALAQLVEVGDRESTARLALGQRLTEDARYAVRRGAPWILRHWMRVPRMEGLHAALSAMALASVGPPGAGLVLDGELAYHAPGAPIVVAAALSPFAAVTETSGPTKHYSYAAHIVAGLDLQWLGVEVGAGIASFHLPVDGQRAHSLVPSFAAGLRLGPLDGLRVRVHGSFALVDHEGSSEVEPGSFWADALVPLAEGFWVQARGNIGTAGFIRVDLGLRMLLTGDLGPGSIFLTVAAGGAAIAFQRVQEDFPSASNPVENLAGPTFGLGLEVRP